MVLCCFIQLYYTVIQLIKQIEQREEKDLILDPGAPRYQVKEDGPADGASGGDGGGGGQADGVRGGEATDDTQTAGDPHQQEDDREC